MNIPHYKSSQLYIELCFLTLFRLLFVVSFQVHPVLACTCMPHCFKLHAYHRRLLVESTHTAAEEHLGDSDNAPKSTNLGECALFDLTFSLIGLA